MNNNLGKIIAAENSAPAPKKFFEHPEYFLSRAVPVLIGINIFLNPFPHSKSLKEISFGVALLLSLWLVFIRRERPFSALPPLATPLLVYLAWASLSIVWSLDRANTLHDLRTHIGHGVLLFYMIVHFFITFKRLTALLWVIVISSALFSGWQLGYFYFIQDNAFSEKLFTGFFEVPVNWIAYFTIFAMAILVMFIEKAAGGLHRIMVSLLLVPVFLVTLATQSRAAIIALFLCSCVVLVKRVKILGVFLLIVSIMIIVNPVKQRFSQDLLFSPANERISIYLTAIQVIKDNPLIGFGYGHEIYSGKINLREYNDKLPEKYHKEAYLLKDPHNLPLDVTAKLGVVGFFMFLLIICSFLRKCLRLVSHGSNESIRDYALILLAGQMAFLIIAMFEPAYAYVAETVFFVILAMLSVLDRVNDEAGTRLESAGK